MENRGDKKRHVTEDFYECQEGSSEHDDLFHAAQEQAWLKCTKVPSTDWPMATRFFLSIPYTPVI